MTDILFSRSTLTTRVKLPSRCVAPAAAAAVLLATAVTGCCEPETEPDPDDPQGYHLDLVGQLDLGSGDNADLAVFRDFVYAGSFGLDFQPNCNAAGIRIADVSDATDPKLVGTLAAHPFTNTAFAQVQHVDTPAFVGDLLVAGHFDCGFFGGAIHGLAGLEMWDVTDPYHPVRLGYFDLGPGTGSSDPWLFVRDDGVYVATAVPFAEVFTGKGDLQFVDVTDPYNPYLLSDWGAGKDGGMGFGSVLYGAGDCTQPPPGGQVVCRGIDQTVYGHTIRTNDAGTRAYAAYFDGGLLTFDITDIANPVLIQHELGDPAEEGNFHSVLPIDDEQRLVVTIEDETPAMPASPGAGDTWGGVQIWDNADIADPYVIGVYQTPNSLTNTYDGVSLTAHNPFVRGDKLYVAWYGDGIHAVDISSPQAPSAIASFSSPGTLYWGVVERNGLIFTLEREAGLQILKLEPTLQEP